MSDKEVKVGVFHLADPMELDEYEKLLNNEEVSIVSQKENWDKFGNLAIYCKWEIEDIL
jgi:hypothetical protein